MWKHRKCYHCQDDTRPHVTYNLYPPIVAPKTSEITPIEFYYCAFCDSYRPLLLVTHIRVIDSDVKQKQQEQQIVYTPIYYCDYCHATCTIGCLHYGSYTLLKTHTWVPVYKKRTSYEHEMTDGEIYNAHTLMLLITKYLYLSHELTNDTKHNNIRINSRLIQKFNNFQLDIEKFFRWAQSRKFIQLVSESPSESTIELTKRCKALYLNLIYAYDDFVHVCYPQMLKNLDASEQEFLFPTIQDAFKYFQEHPTQNITSLYCYCEGTTRFCEYIESSGNAFHDFFTYSTDIQMQIQQFECAHRSIHRLYHLIEYLFIKTKNDFPHCHCCLEEEDVKEAIKTQKAMKRRTMIHHQ